MKNSLLTFMRITLFFIFCIALAPKSYAMDFLASNEEPGYISIVGVNRKELFDALYDHAVEFNQQKQDSAESTGLSALRHSMQSLVATGLKHFGTTSEKPSTMSYAEAAAMFHPKVERHFLSIMPHSSAHGSAGDRALKDEQGITFTSVDGHQLDLKFKRETLLPGQMHDMLYVASYNRMYGEGSAERIYAERAAKGERLYVAEGLLTTLERRSSKESKAAMDERITFPNGDGTGQDEVVIQFNVLDAFEEGK